MTLTAETLMLAGIVVGGLSTAGVTLQKSMNRAAENIGAQIERPTERIPVMPKFKKCDCGCGRANCECGGMCDDE